MAIDLNTLQPTPPLLPGQYGLLGQEAPPLTSGLAEGATPVTAAAPGPAAPPGPWAPPVLPREVELAGALQRAYQVAAAYVNHMVGGQGVAVSVDWRDALAPVGQMVDLQNNTVVKEYQPWQLLKVYAAGPGGKGFIVDGTV